LKRWNVPTVGMDMLIVVVGANMRNIFDWQASAVSSQLFFKVGNSIPWDIWWGVLGIP
jgi:hypothetical protein